MDKLRCNAMLELANQFAPNLAERRRIQAFPKEFEGGILEVTIITKDYLRPFISVTLKEGVSNEILTQDKYGDYYSYTFTPNDRFDTARKLLEHAIRQFSLMPTGLMKALLNDDEFAFSL